MGLFLAWGVLSGDEQGRVNLLYLLFLYLFLPLLSILISTFSLIKGKGIHLARLLVHLPIVDKNLHRHLNHLAQNKLDKHWLFFQSQAAALAFSLASLLVFFILLFATDVNFVWRSTLLQAPALLPLLEWIALPWSFWNEAQPSLDLLQLTQDSRISTTTTAAGVHAAWWPFVLATQLFYSIFLRGFLLFVTRQLYHLKLKRDFSQQLSAEILSNENTSSDNSLAPLENKIPHWLAVNNWANIDLNILSSVEHGLKLENIINGGPLASERDRGFAVRWQDQQVIIVKSWEPPLAELADFMENSQGFLWPVDWRNDQLVPLKKLHLDEWRRFAAQVPNWKIYIPESALPGELS